MPPATDPAASERAGWFFPRGNDSLFSMTAEVAAPATPAPPPTRDWVSPFVAILGCYLLSYATIQFAYPFVGLFVRDLGASEAAAIAWSGAINAILRG